MTDFRQALYDAVCSARQNLACVTEVRGENGLLRVVLKLDRPAFNYRRQINDWMFDCIIKANLACKEQKFVLPLFRGVDRKALNRALDTGIDVEPTDSRWYGAELEKALEYGGLYPAVLILDSSLSERPYRDLPADAPHADHAAARDWSGSEGEPYAEGRWVHYARVGSNDRLRGAAYSTTYAWFIPRDAKKALIGVIECEGPK